MKLVQNQGTAAFFIGCWRLVSCCCPCCPRLLAQPGRLRNLNLQK